MSVDGPQTRIEWVETQMREAILLGELPPGERLLTAALAERFAVSPTPLREAMQRLSGEGLIEFVPQRGARVTPLSVADCLEITELRTLLEGAALDHAASAGDDAWRVRLKDRSRQLLAAWRARKFDPAGSESAYRGFYEEAVSACGSARLRQYARVIREQEARYRLATSTGVDRTALARNHRVMVKALLASDAMAVRGLLDVEVGVFVAAYRSRVEDAETRALG